MIEHIKNAVWNWLLPLIELRDRMTEWEDDE